MRVKEGITIKQERSQVRNKLQVEVGVEEEVDSMTV